MANIKVLQKFCKNITNILSNKLQIKTCIYKSINATVLFFYSLQHNLLKIIISLLKDKL